jgi:hypothetical protein
VDSENEQVEQLNTEEKTINLEITLNELNVVLGALQELPHRLVDGLLNKLVAQGQSQLQQ